jgi:integrase
MIQLQWWCGARSGEVTRLRLADIDRTGSVWLWTLSKHKTAHAGRKREIPLGPKCQEILLPYIQRVPQPDPDQPLFSPQQAEVERRIEQRATRHTKVQPSQAARARKVTPKRQPREHYDPNTYAAAIDRGILAANAAACKEALKDAIVPLVPEAARVEVGRFLVRLPVRATEAHLARTLARAAKRVNGLRRLHVTIDPAPLLKCAIKVLEKAQNEPAVAKWHPHQLRHSCATRVRREAGLESARVILGHADLRMAEHYAELDKARALEVASRMG